MGLTGAQIRESLARRLAASQEADERAAAHAREVLPALVEVLTREFGARRVVLFGSLATGLFTTRSDIDLLAEGIPAHRFMLALERCTQLAGRRVDLVDPEWADASLLEKISRQGETLYVA